MMLVESSLQLHDLFQCNVVKKMNYVVDAHNLNVSRYYIDTINFQRYDLPLRVHQREKVPVGRNCFTRASNYLIDPSELPVCDSTADSENPCRTDSNCLNRILQFKWNPQTCPSKENCHNQRFQKRQYVDCEPCRTFHRGWGLRCEQDVKKGQIVIEYVGELIDEASCPERVRKGEDVTNYYMLTIDKDRIIDAGPMGNLLRFMNHSCDPNCETQKWKVKREVRVGLFASRDIKDGEELTFHYHMDCLGNEKKKCYCGVVNCGSFLGVKPKNQV